MGTMSYTARRIAQQFWEYIGDDESTPGDTFNADMAPHSVDDKCITFDSVADLVNAVRLDGVTFDATGADWASDPDGSQIIDYATAEREVVSWHFKSIPHALLHRVIVPAVDAR